MSYTWSRTENSTNDVSSPAECTRPSGVPYMRHAIRLLLVVCLSVPVFAAATSVAGLVETYKAITVGEGKSVSAFNVSVPLLGPLTNIALNTLFSASVSLIKTPVAALRVNVPASATV